MTDPVPDMRFRLLGNSGLRVAELALGCMTFGENVSWGADRDTSAKIYEAYRNAGGNLIDTANEIYTAGTSERLVGEFVKADRDAIVLATKYTDSLPTIDPNRGGNHRKSLRASLERSLKSLQTDYIDLLWVHAWDFMTPEEEILRALDDAVRAGKVLYIGISDAPAWVVARSNAIAELRGWSSFIGLQIEYSLVQRTVERELLPMARALDIGVVGWSPLGSGVLSGKYGGEQRPEALSKRAEAGFLPLSDRNLAIARRVGEIAKELGVSSAQVAINWVRAKGVIPILGASKPAQIDDNLACLGFTLSPGQVAALDALSAIELGFPHDFLTATRGATYGGTFDRIERHRERGIGKSRIGAAVSDGDR